MGPPYDITVYANEALGIEEARIHADSPLPGRLRELWERHLMSAIDELPRFTAEDLVTPRARAG